MKITDLIAQHILEVHEGNNWTEVDLTDTLQGISVGHAQQILQASPNTIAALLHHITYWNRVMVQRTVGVSVILPETNGYDVSILKTEKDWRLLKEDNLRSAHELANAIRNFDEEKLLEPIIPGYPTAYKNLQGSVEHVHYHLGQMVILKKLIESED